MKKYSAPLALLIGCVWLTAAWAVDELPAVTPIPAASGAEAIAVPLPASDAPAVVPPADGTSAPALEGVEVAAGEASAPTEYAGQSAELTQGTEVVPAEGTGEAAEPAEGSDGVPAEGEGSDGATAEGEAEVSEMTPEEEAAAAEEREALYVEELLAQRIPLATFDCGFFTAVVPEGWRAEEEDGAWSLIAHDRPVTISVSKVPSAGLSLAEAAEALAAQHGGLDSLKKVSATSYDPGPDAWEYRCNVMGTQMYVQVFELDAESYGCAAIVGAIGDPVAAIVFNMLEF